MPIKKRRLTTAASLKIRKRARVELIYAIVLVGMLIALSSLLEWDFVESLYNLTRKYEQWELDEVIFSFLWIAIVAIIYSIRRVLDIMALNKETAQNAYFDILTGLPNRVLAQQQLEKMLAHAYRYKLSMAVIFIDLNNFKEINDNYGHKYGDKLLQQVSRELSAVTRNEEIIARLGGDEFIVAGEFRESYSHLEALLERLQNCQDRDYIIDGQPFSVRFSIGIAVSPAENASIDELMAAADSAMYEAKRNRSLTAYFYTEQIGQIVKERYRLSSNLKTALNEHQLFLVYQPIVDMQGHIKGYESLTRWQLDGQFINPEHLVSLVDLRGCRSNFFNG